MQYLLLCLYRGLYQWQLAVFGGIGNQGTAALRHDVVFSAYDASDTLIVSQVIAPPILSV